MSRLLSQQEIDALLSSRQQMAEADSGESLNYFSERNRQRSVNPYNFKRPRLFAQDQMRVLNHIHEAFARNLSGYLSAQLRTIVNINLYTIDQVLYSEYVLSSAPPSALYVVSVKELDQNLVIELDPRLIVFIVEKLFGGPGIFIDTPREISLIEKRIMERVTQNMFRELEKAWEDIFSFHLEHVAFESNAEFVQIIPGVEPVMVITLEVSVYDKRTLLNICYPYLILERMLTRSGTKRWLKNVQSRLNGKVGTRIKQALSKVEVPLRAELGRTYLTLRQIGSLQVGDVIPLNRRIHEPLEVYVGDALKFRAEPGRTGKRHALRIQEILEPNIVPEEDDDYEG